FVSSRRRHTRSKRDWSSDVCSSDLQNPLLFRGSLPETMKLGAKFYIMVPLSKQSSFLPRQLKSKCFLLEIHYPCEQFHFASAHQILPAYNSRLLINLLSYNP